MPKLHTLTGILLLIGTLACNLPNQVAPTRPPLPTLPEVARPTNTPETVAVPTDTPAPATTVPEATATIEDTLEPTTEPSPTSPPPTAANTAIPTNSPTPRPVIIPTNTPEPTNTPSPGSGGPLRIRAVKFVSAQKTSDSGSAIVTLSLEFHGGDAPYTLTGNDGQPTGEPAPRGTFLLNGEHWQYIYFTEQGACGTSLAKTVTIYTADGQQQSQAYFVDLVQC